MDSGSSYPGKVDAEIQTERRKQQLAVVPVDDNDGLAEKSEGDGDFDTELEKKDGSEHIEREGWDSKADFILAMIGYAVGLGNIWRFPYLCYRNGGGAFLIPYVLSLCFFGIPAFYMEEGFGQFRQTGGLSAWHIIPVFKGCGYMAATIACMMNIYYIVIIAWIIIYLIFSFSPTLPWSICYGWWNDIYCYDSKTMNTTNNATEFITGEYNNVTIPMSDAETPAEQYWNNFVLQISDGIHAWDGIVWYLALSLLAAWGLVYLCIWKGVKTTGKIVWFTTTFPYVVLTILLIRAVTLPGASEGIYYYLVPDLSRLSDAQVWVDAASQIFFSLGIGFSGLISLGSYNKYNNNVLIDTLIVCLVNCCTSLYAGFMIFGCLGYMAWDQGKEVDEVVDSGPGLTFIAVPTAIAEMPAAQFWAICFFIMLLMLGLDSQFCVVEGFYTCIADEYPKIFRKHRTLYLAILCGIYYLMALPCVTRGGMYIFNLMDNWGASGYVLLWCTMWECIAICFGWGYKKYLDALEDMLGYRPNIAWPILWAIVLPLGLIIIQLFSFVTYTGAFYEDYRYPIWGECLGWLMSAFSMHWVLSYFIFAFILALGSFQERWKVVRKEKPGVITLDEKKALTSGEDHDDEPIGGHGTYKSYGDDEPIVGHGTFKSYEEIALPAEQSEKVDDNGDKSYANAGSYNEATTAL